MDSRRCSAAFGFILLICCVIGIVILIHNSGSSRRSTEPSILTSKQNNHHHHRVPSTTVVGGKRGGAGVGGDPFVPSSKVTDGFSNDPNYQPVQPTMQEVNELADELNRFLSSKSKHVLGSSNNGKGTPVNTGMITAMKKTNGTVSPTSSATSSAKASITAVNYSSIPKKKPAGSVTFESPSFTAEPMPNLSSASSIATNFSSFQKNRPLTSSSVIRQEVPENHKDQQKLQNHHYNHNQKPYPGQQSPSLSPSLHHNFRPTTTQMMVDSVEDRIQRGGGGSSGGFAPNDLYTKSWHPSMVSPAAGGGIPVVPLPNHPYHHRTHNINNPPQSPQRPSSPAKINKTGKGTGYHTLSHQYENRAPIPKQYHHQYGYHHYQHDREEVDPDQDGDFVEIDENDVSGNLANLKREGEGADEDNNNDMVHNNEEVEELEEGDEEEEEDDDDDDEDEEEDNVANPGFLLEPKNFAADLETLFSLANHLYTSPASLISTFSALAAAKTNSTKKTDNQESSSSASTPLTSSAFQGLLKVINETIQRGNSSKLVAELNEMYRGREARTDDLSLKSSVVNSTSETFDQASSLASSLGFGGKGELGEKDKDQSPYEKSLTAFVFMSFGVFLLNQIHSFVQKTAGTHLNHMSNNETDASEGRTLPWEKAEGPFTWYSPTKSDMIMTSEPSSLDILFKPPVTETLNTSSSSRENETVSGRSSDMDDNDDTIVMWTGGQGHVNNMFRALLNIANAYTKDSPALECIWSLYCQDLDETAQQRGLYGVAARINSVGLRLIMKQIPPALTFDVILRSLVGWDGLPCRKMFPECSVGNGTMSVVADDGDEEEDSSGMEKVVTLTSFL